MALPKRHSFMLRLPVELNEFLDEQAAKNQRSKNAEILFRLEQGRIAGAKEGLENEATA